MISGYDNKVTLSDTHMISHTHTHTHTIHGIKLNYNIYRDSQFIELPEYRKDIMLLISIVYK